MYYRFIKRWPRTLEYRNATVTLEIVQREADAEFVVAMWVLQARKIGFRDAEPCILCRAFTSQQLDHVLTHGFTVERGSPEERVFWTLEKLGCVESSHRAPKYH